MAAKASHEERVLLYRLDREVVNLSNMAGAFDESGKLGKIKAFKLEIEYCIK